MLNFERPSLNVQFKLNIFSLKLFWLFGSVVNGALPDTRFARPHRQ